MRYWFFSLFFLLVVSCQVLPTTTLYGDSLLAKSTKNIEVTNQTATFKANTDQPKIKPSLNISDNVYQKNNSSQSEIIVNKKIIKNFYQIDYSNFQKERKIYLDINFGDHTNREVIILKKEERELFSIIEQEVIFKDLNNSKKSLPVFSYNRELSDWLLDESAIVSISPERVAIKFKIDGSYLLVGSKVDIDKKVMIRPSQIFSDVDGDQGLSIKSVSDNNLMGERILLVLIHGAGSENEPRYRWGNFLDYLKSYYSGHDEFCKRFSITNFRYNSKLPVEKNALKLKGLLDKKYLGVPYILLAHSMGGLVAETNYYWDQDNLCLGVITLGSPLLGSPLAIDKWVNASFSRQPFADLNNTFYLLFRHNYLSALVDNLKTNDLTTLVNEGGDILNDSGYRCLAWDDSFPGIPRLKYQVTYWLNGIPVIQDNNLDSTDNKRAILSQEISNQFADLDIGLNYNYSNFLAQIAKKKNQKHLICFAGYYQDLQKLRQDKDSLIKIGLNNLDILVKGVSDKTVQDFLAWAGYQMFLLPTASHNKTIENTFAANDGLVPVTSGLNLNLSKDTKILTTNSNWQKIIVDPSQVEKYLRPSVAQYYLMENYSHLDLAQGKNSHDNQYFDKIINSVYQLANNAGQIDQPQLNFYIISEIGQFIREKYKKQLQVDNIQIETKSNYYLVDYYTQNFFMNLSESKFGDYDRKYHQVRVKKINNNWHSF